MSASGSASDARYDCFISFHGGQKLFDLGYSWAGPDATVRDLARGAFERLRDYRRNPSVFYDHEEISGRFRDDLGNAVLQLRGGGVALVLLTGESLRRKYCLGELRAFLELEKLARVEGRKSEAVSLRVVCLDRDSSAVRTALADPALQPFIDELGKIHIHQLTQTGTRALVLTQICDHVLSFWNENQSLCLGKKKPVCAYYMSSFLVNTPVSLIANSFGIRGQTETTRESLFDQALQQDKISAHSLNALSRVTTTVDAKAALAAFEKKWISDGWSWSLEPGENRICLSELIDEADEVLSSATVVGKKVTMGRGLPGGQDQGLSFRAIAYVVAWHSRGRANCCVYADLASAMAGYDTIPTNRAKIIVTQPSGDEIQKSGDKQWVGACRDEITKFLQSLAKHQTFIVLSWHQYGRAFCGAYTLLDSGTEAYQYIGLHCAKILVDKPGGKVHKKRSDADCWIKECLDAVPALMNTVVELQNL